MNGQIRVTPVDLSRPDRPKPPPLALLSSSGPTLTITSTALSPVRPVQPPEHNYDDINQNS